MPKITGLRKDKHNRTVIFIDGKPAITAATSTVQEEKLAIDQEIDTQRLQEIQNSEALRRCYEAALRLLNNRPHGERELIIKLKKRRFTETEINTALGKLKEQGLVNDNEFAGFWVENRETFRPKSRALIARELKNKGLNEDIIHDVISGLNDEETAYRAGLTKARKLNITDYREFKLRLGNYLQRRGFNYETIEKTVNKLWQEIGNASQTENCHK